MDHRYTTRLLAFIAGLLFFLALAGADKLTKIPDKKASESVSSVDRVGAEFVNAGTYEGDHQEDQISGYQVNVTKVFIIIGATIFMLMAVLALQDISARTDKADALLAAASEENSSIGDVDNVVIKNDLDDGRSWKMARMAENVLNIVDKLYKTYDIKSN